VPPRPRPARREPLHALVFPIGAERYALPVDQVKEVVAAPAVTPLPTAPGAVLGLVNLRGDVLPLFDVGRLVGSPSPADAAFVMVVDTPAGLACLPASGLPRLVELGPPSVSGLATWPGNVHTVDGEPVVLLDAGAIIGRAAPA
jgi:chemotaxis signal transduction protein